MLVDNDHIIEEVRVDERAVAGGTEGVQLRYNHTEPSVISDGIDVIAIIEESDEQYRIDYWGYSYGRLRVTADGVAQLAQDHLADQDTIPNWTVDPETVEADNPPWWLPEETEIDPMATCGHCETDVSVQEVVTPRRPPAPLDCEILCRDCWDEYG